MAMLMWHLTVVWFFAAILSKYQAQASTRWQPSIIWDRFNPLLTCPCNWMNIPKFAIYDRVELLCPKTYLVSSFRTKDMAKREVYYHIFMRKYKYKNETSLDELRQQLDSGDFCDRNQSKILYTCRRDDTTVSPPKLYESYKVRFHSDEDLYDGDVVVFFNNKATGLEVDLDSKDKKCEMVLVVNVTNAVKQEYDAYYEKCSTPGEDTLLDTVCRNINDSSCQCGPEPKYINNTQFKNITVRVNITRNFNNTIIQVLEVGPRPGPDGFDAKYFAFGLILGIILTIVFGMVLYQIVVKKKGKPTFSKRKEELQARMEKQPSGDKNFASVVTIENNSSDKSNDTADLSEIKTDQKQSTDTGFPNKGFQPSTPSPTDPPREEPEYPMSNQARSCNGRLPSVDGGARVLPPLKFKHQTRPSSFEKKEKQGKNQQNGYNAART